MITLHEEGSLMEDKRQGTEGAHLKPLVSLFLRHKMVAVCCFLWPPAFNCGK